MVSFVVRSKERVMLNHGKNSKNKAKIKDMHELKSWLYMQMKHR